MKKLLNISVYILGTLIVIGLVAYVLFQRKIVITHVAHDDWKTYVNESAGYSIQYPPEVHFSEDASTVSNKGVRNIDLIVGNDAKGIRITALVKDVNWDRGDICFPWKRKVLIDNKEWFRQNCKIGYFGAKPDITVDYTRDTPELLYTIQLNYGKAVSEEEKVLMESMISTFKFIQRSLVVSDTNTYSNSKLKVSFKYPADWRIMEGLDQVVADVNSPNGSMRFDIFKFDASSRTDLQDSGECNIKETSGGAQLLCLNDNLPEYIIKYGNNIYLLTFSKHSWEVSDPAHKDEFERLTAAMFSKNESSFQTILSSMRLMK